MTTKEYYTNGQKIYEQSGDQLTYFFKTGALKAKGPFINGRMEGEWHFYRETGQLAQIGHFKNGQKHDSWVRYDKHNKIDYQEDFDKGKKLKKQT